MTIDKDTILIKYYKVSLISGEVLMGNKVNETATEIFLDTELGKIIILKQENKMDIVTAVSGSGPAYVFLFMFIWIFNK